MTMTILIGWLAPLVIDAEGILELQIPHFLRLIEKKGALEKPRCQSNLQLTGIDRLSQQE